MMKRYYSQISIYVKLFTHIQKTNFFPSIVTSFCEKQEFIVISSFSLNLSLKYLLIIEVFPTRPK